MSNKRKINVKIQGQATPFQTEISDADTFIALKNKLYLQHEKIVDLVPFINGKIPVKQVKSTITDILDRNPEFVFLMFSSASTITSASNDAKVAGLTDHNLKPDYLKNFGTPTVVTAQNAKLQSKLKNVELSKQGKSATSVRITDLTHEQLLKLLSILKIQSGRYLDERMQIVTSNKESLTYAIKDEDYEDIIEDKGVSHFFHNQNITQETKQVYEQGFNDQQLRNKVPYLFAFSLDREQNYFKFERIIKRSDCTYVQHCFPRGEVNLITVQACPKPELVKYFENGDFSYENVKNFYRTYGQFIIKKFTVGLKRVCSQKIMQSSQSKSNEQAERFATMAAGRIRQYMLQSATQAGKGEKTASVNVKTQQQIHYDIKAIGGAIEHCQNVALWKQSVNVWELWRIISVNEIARVQNFLPGQAQALVAATLNERLQDIYESRNAKIVDETSISSHLTASKQVVKIQSNFQNLCNFKQKIYQILPLDSNNLVLVFIDKVMRFNLSKNEVDFSLQFRERAKCIYERQPGYLAAAVAQNAVFIATQNGIVKVNFADLTFKVIASGNWRESTFLMLYKNKMYANGWKGIYEINIKTGEYNVIIGGDWRCYTGTRIRNNVFMFFWNIYCLDLDSMTYSKIHGGLWNEIWDNYTYPTNDGSKIWQLYKGTLYCLTGNQYYPVQFSKKGVKMNKFSGRSVCYHKGCLYVSNFDHNQHLLKIPM